MRLPRFRIGSSLILGVVFLCTASIASANISFDSTVATSGLGALQGLWVSSTGDMYAVNAGATSASRILHFSATGVLLTSRIINGALPRTINVDPTTGYVYVTGSGKLLQYTDFDNSSSYNVLISSGLSVSTLAPAQGMTFNSDRTKLYVGTSGSKVKVYNTGDWSLLQTLTLPGAVNITDPGPIAFDIHGNLYVVDYRTTNIASPVGNGRIIKIASGSTTGHLFNSGYVDTNNANAADSPSGIFVDSTNHLYVLLRGSRAGGDGAIYKYDASGTLITTLRTSGAGVLNLPIGGLWVDANGNIYAVSSNGGLIKKFIQTIDSPYGVTGNGVEVSGVLSWENTDNPLFDSVVIRRDTTGFPATESDGTAVASGITGTSYTDSGLTPGTTYLYSLFTKDQSGNYSNGTHISLTPPGLNPPSNVSYSNTMTTATLSWTNTANALFDSVTIRRSTTSYPSTVNDGTGVVMGFTGTSYTDAGLTPGTTYYYSLFSKDKNGYDDNRPANLSVYLGNTCLLKAYWQMDASPDTPIDATGNGYNGTVAGTGSTPSLSTDVPTTGLINPYSFSFDGNDSFSVSRPVEDDFSICSWIKTTAVGAGTGNDHFVSMAIAHAETPFIANDFGFGVDGNGHLVFGDGNGVSDYAVHGSTAVNTGNWVHACMTRSKSSGAMNVYVNGVLDGSGVGSTATLSSNSTLTIGNGTDGGLFWNGLLDGIRVYDFVLTPTEISSLAGGVNACYSESVLPPSSSSSSSSEAPVQSKGGSRGGNTQRATHAAETRVAATATAHPSAPTASSQRPASVPSPSPSTPSPTTPSVSTAPAASIAPAVHTEAVQLLSVVQTHLEARVAEQIAARPSIAPMLKKVLARMETRIAKLSRKLSRK